MQFFEFILWRNLDNYFINNLTSTLALLLVTVQPIASLSTLEEIPLRNKLISVYSIPAFTYIIYKLKNNNANTTISKIGHLKWNWASNTNKILSVFVHSYFLFFLYFALFYNKHYYGIAISLPLFIVMYYYYYKDGSAGSLWCSSINIVMVYFLLELMYVNRNLIKY